jgi:ABC-type glycerol-3-phosphate transport system substrate-binding protein
MLLTLTLALGLAACGGESATGEGAAQAVESYLTALVNKDSDKLMSLSCADFEADATLELDAFQAVEAALKDASCVEAGTEGDATLVACTGAIVATYGGEDQALDLSGRVYKVVQEGGDWLVCGYAK